MMTQPVSLSRRLAALFYESLLIGSATMLSGFVAGIINTQIVLHLPQAKMLAMPLTSIILLYTWWLYFKLNWHREGQTLPMRVWKIGLCDRSGNRPTLRQLLLRFLWATIFIVFVPLIAYAGLSNLGFHGKTAMIAALFWWILPWGFALFHTRKQFLYDYLAGTELVDLRQK